ncbi:MAG: acyl-CoA dehydratase activase [Caldimicrobium sp.]
MKILGLDLGSRTLKWCLFEAERMVDFGISDSGFFSAEKANAIIEKLKPHKIIATGYGRFIAKELFNAEVISEIKAHALGAQYFLPELKTIIDIGGQDSKVIKLNSEGKVVNFLMNEKCAAGTGRFLEVMALSLGLTLEEISSIFPVKDSPIKIGSMCTVFAESEVISLKHKGVPLEFILTAIYESVADRILAMLSKLTPQEPMLFSGGVAKNKAFKTLLEEKIGCKIVTPEKPELTGAVGCALYALNSLSI